MMLDLAARTIGGPDASLTPHERGLIEAPLARLLARHAGISDRMAAMADPIALLVGLVMWGGRVMQLQSARALGTAPVRVPAPGVDLADRTPPPAAPPRQTIISGQGDPVVTFTPAPSGPIEMVEAAIYG
jgi:hypothetical protein